MCMTCTPPSCTLLGFDHEKLTYRYNGRDERLTITEGVVATDIIG